MTVTGVSTTWAVTSHIRVKVILYHQSMVFMSLLIDAIGQLNCHVIGCEDTSIVYCSTPGFKPITIFPQLLADTYLYPWSERQCGAK